MLRMGKYTFSLSFSLLLSLLLCYHSSSSYALVLPQLFALILLNHTGPLDIMHMISRYFFECFYLTQATKH